jgi:hypothetical protein
MCILARSTSSEFRVQPEVTGQRRFLEEKRRLGNQVGISARLGKLGKLGEPQRPGV